LSALHTTNPKTTQNEILQTPWNLKLNILKWNGIGKKNKTYLKNRIEKASSSPTPTQNKRREGQI
jgi:hypothetical protein